MCALEDGLHMFNDLTRTDFCPDYTAQDCKLVTMGLSRFMTLGPNLTRDIFSW